MHEHLDRRFLNIGEDRELVLEVKHQELVFFFGPLCQLLQDETFDVDFAILEQFIENFSVLILL